MLVDSRRVNSSSQPALPAVVAMGQMRPVLADPAAVGLPRDGAARVSVVGMTRSTAAPCPSMSAAEAFGGSWVRPWPRDAFGEAFA